MTAMPGAEGPLATTGPEIDPEPALFARIEGLTGEEDALLRIPAEQRSAEQRDRLRRIGDELDRIWEHLRDRARRRDRAAEAGS